MTPLKEIGECLIGGGEKEYFFRPSFRNMTRIGKPSDIVKAFYDLHSDEITPLLRKAFDAYGYIPSWLSQHMSGHHIYRTAIHAAHTVLTACSDADISPLVGWMVPGRTGRRAFVWRRGAMSPESMIIVAQSLITHGIIGKAKIRKLQRHENNETTKEFIASDYIMAARHHFDITRDEAENLTMTEFALMLATRYPNQKGFTREEFDAVMDEDEKRWNAMIERDKAKNKSARGK